MKHLTHVGYHAGQPICGAVRQPEDTGEHYGTADARYKTEHEAGTLCSACYTEHLTVIATEFGVAVRDSLQDWIDEGKG